MEHGTGISIHAKELTEHLAPFGLQPVRRLPPYVRELSARQARILLDALILGDGYDGRNNTKNHHTEVIYFTSSAGLADDVQELAIKAGIAATVTVENRIGAPVRIKGRGQTGVVRYLQYRVSLHQQMHVHAIGKNLSRRPYDGMVYCVSVPNRTVQVRRHGKTFWNGNCFEPWLAAGSGAGSGTAGFTLYVDNGTGTASSGLVAAVQAFITGSATSNQSGYRPAGVPFTVSGTTPVYATVTVSGLLLPGLLSTGAVVSTVTANIQSYFDSLGIAPAAAYQPQIAGQAADAGLGAFQSLTVSLYYSGSGTSVPVVSGATGTRVILSSLTVNMGVAS